MKLFELYLHLTEQKQLIMESPPRKNRDFASIVKEHSRIINKVCWVYSTPKVPYEDLHQEILTNLWLCLDQYRGDSNLSTWVYRVSVNSALMAIRNYKPKVETFPFEISAVDISSESEDNKAEQLTALHELINQLLPIEKAIILLWLDEYSYEEIVDIIGIKRNNVATKLHRIKNKLISNSK
ncbi:MAG: sigma-70 family RNA polymerase sigma factor [Muribaculaceae bacterium]|nr:sigma-70 family RNA polymerase sigma factor [Muribaculaceae bacterium]